jgi:hypothetical protein
MCSGMKQHGGHRYYAVKVGSSKEIKNLTKLPPGWLRPALNRYKRVQRKRALNPKFGDIFFHIQ